MRPRSNLSHWWCRSPPHVLSENCALIKQPTPHPKKTHQLNICLWWTPHVQLPHSCPPSSQQISIHSRNGPLQDLIPYTHHSSAYSGQSQISLFWPIHELPAPLTIQSRIRQLAWEPDISWCFIPRDFILLHTYVRNQPVNFNCSSRIQQPEHWGVIVVWHRGVTVVRHRSNCRWLKRRNNYLEPLQSH